MYDLWLKWRGWRKWICGRIRSGTSRGLQHLNVCIFIQFADLSKHTWHAHSFVNAIPSEWNKLPQAIRTQDSISGFRQQLKMYLFSLFYPLP